MSTLGFSSPEDFFNMPTETTAYTVDGLLPSRGLSVWVAKPKVAKSTLLRQLAVSVAKGQPFLERDVEQGSVLYLALEEKPSEVQSHLKLLGCTANDPIYVRCGAVDRQNALAALEADIKSHPNVQLVIIDTLLKFTKGIKDVNEYQQVNVALEPLLSLARDCNVHIATAAHAKKRESEDLRDGILGSTAIAGAVDTLLLIRSGKGGIRTLTTIQRYGSDLEPTELCWDAERRSMSLGRSLSDNQQQSTEAIRVRMENETLAYVREHPYSTQAEILGSVHGNGTVRREVFDQIVEAGWLTCSGSGCKGSPFRYRVPELPYLTESAALIAA